MNVRNKKVCIMQGDEYPLYASIFGETGNIITDQDVSQAEFIVGKRIRKVFPETVTFDKEKMQFVIPLKQAETFSLQEGEASVQVRVLFITGEVSGGDAIPVFVKRSESKEVLK